MCGRARCTLDPDSIARVARAPPDRWTDRERYRPSYNVTPGHYTPIVRPARERDGDGGGGKERAVHVMKWGLVPSFTKKDEKPDHFRMFNARSESVREKSAFRRLIPHSRCIALVEGFYEWKKDGTKKQPYYVRLQDDEPLAFAALYDRWERADGDVMYTYTVLTTRAAKRLEWLHDRMPVILRSEDDIQSWLDPDLPAERIPHLSQPYEGPDLVWHAVTPAMGSPAFNGPECVQEVKPKAVGESAIAQLFRKQNATAPGHSELSPHGGADVAVAAQEEGDAAGAVSDPGCDGCPLSDEDVKALEAGVHPDRDVTADILQRRECATSFGESLAGDRGAGGSGSRGADAGKDATVASDRSADANGGGRGAEEVDGPLGTGTAAVEVHEERTVSAEGRKRAPEGVLDPEVETPPKRMRAKQAASSPKSSSRGSRAAPGRIHSPKKGDKQTSIASFFKTA